MKKLVVFIAALVIAVPLFAAPTAKGNLAISVPMLSFDGLMFGGDLYKDAAGDALTFSDYGTTAFTLNGGSIEYFVIDNLAVGLIFNYEAVGKADATYNYGLTVGYYMPMGAIVPYGQVGFLMIPEIKDAGQAKMNVLAIEVGAAYMVGNNIAPYAGLGFEYDMGEDDSGYKINLALGVKFFF